MKSNSFKLSLAVIVVYTGVFPAQLPKQTKRSFVVTAKVDERVELLSIVARLAGYEEYVNNQFKLYANDVDSYFDRYKQHPAVQFAIKIRGTNHIGYDAVMAMAVHLNSPPALTPRIAFTNQVPDPRWGKDTAEQFVALLQQFYKDTHCDRFFQAHADVYRATEQRFQLITGKVDFDWFRRFYGESPKGTFNLYIGLLNGGGNFGPKLVYPDGTEDRYAIIGTSKVDGEGLPIYGDNTLSLIIHEYNHSFINHLVFEHEQQLSAAGEKVFRPVAERMKFQAYESWQVTLIESLVRTGEIRYKFEHDADPHTAYQAITRERGIGFLWIEELSALLGTYENSRSSYPTFRSFFPIIVGYFIDLSKRIEYLARRLDELSPRVDSMSPFPNGAQDVDPNTTRLTFTFDRPLDTKGGYSFDIGSGGNAHWPIEKVLGFNETGSTFTIQVKLKPDWEYEMVLTGRGFRTKDGYPLQPYPVKFRTK